MVTRSTDKVCAAWVTARQHYQWISFFIPRKGGPTPPLQLSCILVVVALSCTFVAQKYQNARHTEKAVRRLFAYKSHATFFGRAAGAKAHSFGELKFPASQTLLARNGAITASPAFFRPYSNTATWFTKISQNL